MPIGGVGICMGDMDWTGERGGNRGDRGNPVSSGARAEVGGSMGGEDGGGVAERLAELEGQVGELEEVLARSHRLMTLGTIVASIAHELNNILTPVMSYAELARLHPEDSGLRERALLRIEQGAARASGITTAILGFVGPGGGEGGQTCEVGEAVVGALQCLARDPGADGIEVVIEVPGGLVGGMERTRLQHVVLNLVLNARRAMSEGGGRLTIRAWRGGDWQATPAGMEGGGRVESSALKAQSSQHEGRGGDLSSESSDSRFEWSDVRVEEPGGDGEWVVVEVSDTGCGMDVGTMGRLFRAFGGREREQRDNTSTQSRGSRQGQGSRGGGTGLGLAICRRLVEDAGGVIAAWSKVGGGTVFRVVLPGG